MTSYSSTVKEHNVNKEFIPLETLIEGLKKLENLSQDDFTNIVRVEYILNNIQEALKSSDRQLISLSWLNKAYDALKNINSELVNYQSSRNATHLNSNMSPQLDVILEVTANINMVKSKPTLQGVMASINRYQESIEGYLSQIGDQETILKEHIEELSASIKNSNIDLEVSILNYEEGNAFKRWLMPGWGATILNVEAILKENGNIIDMTTHNLVVADYKTVLIHGVRIIPFNELSEEFGILLADIIENYLVISKNAGYLFTTKTGQPIAEQNITKIFAKALINDKPTNATELRNLFISEKIIDENISLDRRKRLAYIMGHTIQTQTFIYSKYSQFLHKKT